MSSVRDHRLVIVKGLMNEEQLSLRDIVVSSGLSSSGWSSGKWHGRLMSCEPFLFYSILLILILLSF